MLVQFVLFDGFDPLDVVAPYEVFAAAGLLADGAVTLELVSAEGAREVPSGTPSLALRATGRLDPARGELIVLPGAVGDLRDGDDLTDEERAGTIPAILGRTLSTGLPALVDEALRREGLTVATVCGGSLIPAMAGLIEGRNASTHHLGMDLLEATGVVPVNARVVDDGDLVTAAGVTSGLDLALYLLERELGPRMAHAVEQYFAYERRGTVWHDRGLIPALAL